jgi:hypothetical protein
MPSANAKWYRLPNEGLLVLSEGDLTVWSGDAVVNAGAPAWAAIWWSVGLGGTAGTCLQAGAARII